MGEDTKLCPMCGEEILAVARKCRFCGSYLDQEAARQAARVPGGTIERLVVPMDLPGSAIAAGYLGLGALFPLIGLPLGVLAIIYGVNSLRIIGRDPTLHGKGRAWFGILAGAIGVLVWGVMGVFMIAALVFDPAH